MLLGIKPFDALHVACAIMASADLFVTTDDALLRNAGDEVALPRGFEPLFPP